MANKLSAVIDRFEGKYAVLEFEDGAEVLWPKKLLSKDLCEGSVVRIEIKKDKTAEKDLRKSITELQDKLRKKQT